MSKKNFKYIYGPVMSWRLGTSLGIDPISEKEKTCSFDCIYCQIGRTKVFNKERKIFVAADEIMKETDLLPEMAIDYITFSGTGEPTLAANLGKMIKAVKQKRREKVAVITNSSLIDKKDVQEDLFGADCIIAKLDAHAPGLFEKINQPMKKVSFHQIIKGIKEFNASYDGKFALQIMFTEENRKYAEDIAKLANNISPKEIQLNTPLRPCNVLPLGKEALNEIKQVFLKECKNSINIIGVYDIEKKKTEPISNKDTLKRRGKTY
ncbi:MAG: radical SAM protein [Candidatus Margulisbacteria bacterium]|nr:radical SAM protein [Candidatus Margulisiibacteriota bacterium]